MEKWVKNTMPKSGSKIAVNPRIKRAVDNRQLGLSRGRPVLRYNSYFNSYKAEELPLIKNKKQVYKTHCLDKSNGHYINYGLRAAVLGLLQAAKTEDSIETHLVTVDLNSDFSKKITSGSGTRNTAQYFNRMFRLKVAVPMCFSHYFFVIEQSKSGNLHVHVLMNIDVRLISDLKDMIKSNKWHLIDIKGNYATTAIKVNPDYVVRLKRRSMTKLEAEVLDMEVEDYEDESLWKGVGKRTSIEGEVYFGEFQLKEKHPIDEGIADYLCKSMTDSLFYGGKNYAMSRSLKAIMEPFINQVIEEGKLRSKS
jgi:hypothetical protein